ncbi:MAG: MoxR family ATPase [Eggerthellaceae bacterium]|nr:MoxR family ATPase [Eggerthellaceae bacterium]
MIIKKNEQIIREVSKAIVGKDDVIRKVLMTIYAGGNVLLEDAPGVGKTTLALAFSRALGLDFRRVQFTPDTMPSDITGFSMYNRQTDSFEFKMGAVNCNLLLGDEINRTSAKTQAALLEVMEEQRVTVDGVTHSIPKPFIVIATQNPVGSAGTQPLPDSQLDRFMVRLSIGYPSHDMQVKMIEDQLEASPLDSVQEVATRDDLFMIQHYLTTVRVSREIMDYIVRLCEATREMPLVQQGVSPRGVLTLVRMARASAVLGDRDYVTPDDVLLVFKDVCAHRMVLRSQARIDGVTAFDVLDEVVAATPAPTLGSRMDARAGSVASGRGAHAAR